MSHSTESAKPLIMLEFNELTPSLMFEFIKAGHLPNFRRLHDESHVFTTDAEATGEDLNPWVQWVTAHSGLSVEEHGIKRLSDGHRLGSKVVWDILSDEGFRVWVCGSMNARYDRPLKGCLLPDPWSSGLVPYPVDELRDYYDFVRTQVQEHTNQARTPSKRDALKFLTFMLRHGLSVRTILNTVGQLAGELRGHGKWKRAVLLDQLQADVFHHYYRKLQPHFSTFFLNSTAHFQHSYWRNMAPESFAVRPSDADNREYGQAILYGYQKMDQIVGQFLKLAGRDATIMFCTGLSQQPYLKAEATGGRYYFRLIGEKVLTDKIGITDRFEYNPVMSDQALLRFADEAACVRAVQTLNAYRLFDGKAFFCQPDGNSLMVQSQWTKSINDDAEIIHAETGRRIPFFQVFYSMDVVKSGFHHPDGMLWVRHPSREHAVHDEKLSLRAIHPMVLEHFGLATHRRFKETESSSNAAACNLVATI